MTKEGFVEDSTRNPSGTKTTPQLLKKRVKCNKNRLLSKRCVLSAKDWGILLLNVLIEKWLT